MDINALRAELYTVNAERFALQTQVWELEEENTRLSAALYAGDQWVAEIGQELARELAKEV